MDNDFLLIDRIDAIRKTVDKYGIHNFVLSFSGGKDSTVLHYLLDLAIPGNKIPRVYIDTGIEYAAIKEYIYSLKDNDERINIIKPKYPIGKIFKDYGYLFKSKEHSQMVHLYQQNGHSKSTIRYSSPPSGKRKIWMS